MVTLNNGKISGQLLEYSSVDDKLQLVMQLKPGAELTILCSPWDVQIKADINILHSGRVGAGYYRGHADFETKAEALLWTQQYLQNYHPAGYGTICSNPIELSTGWRVNVERAGSCD
jgi:hypothetical protein